MADANIEGHIETLVRRVLRGPIWNDLWIELGLAVETFESLDIPTTLPDDVLWRCCQTRRLILLTDNRNRKGPQSLEDIIREALIDSSLPIITIGNSDRLRNSPEYASTVGEALMDQLLNIENLLGTGRLYVP